MKSDLRASALALRLAVIAGFLLAPLAARAEPAPAAAPAETAPAGPPTLKDFLAPQIVSQVKLAPNGKSIVLVRRVGEVDQLIRLDLPDFKATALYQTAPVRADLAKRKFRQEIAFLDWKSNDRLVLSINTPLDLGDGDFIEAPVHMILASDGKSPPIYLNAKTRGSRNSVDISWIQSLLKGDPDHVMIGVRPDLTRLQLYRVNIADGERTLLETDDNSVAAYGTDEHGNILTRTIEHDDGSLTLQGRAVGETKWTKVFDLKRKDGRALAKYDLFGMSDRQTLFIGSKPETAADGDTEVVRTYDLKTQTVGPVVWSNPKYDVDSIVRDSDSQDFLAGCYWVDTLQCEFKSPKLTANLKGLDKFFDGQRNLSIVSQSDDDGQWIIYVTGPDEPGSYFVYDVAAHHLNPLGVAWPNLTTERLGHMRRMSFKSRDGADLSAYVTEPPGAPKGPLPLVVLPHGGPEVRDTFTFDTLVQFLATRGYVVLQPNYRGSGGFGRKFAEAGYGQWGGLMHDDVMDATRALIAEGHVDPKRVCIVGGSYGGYEALYSAAVEAQTFHCAVSIDGVSDLVTDMKAAKRYGRDSFVYQYLQKAEGDPDVDTARMNAHSPVRMAQTWTLPVLIIHGDADPIVPVEQSREMKRALEAAQKPVHYVEIKDMGHGPSTDDEITKVYSELESFLAPYLGSADAAPSPTTAVASKASGR